MPPDLPLIFTGLPQWAVWATGLILAICGAISLSGLISWRMGERGGLPLAIWGAVYLGWLILPLRLPPDLRHVATFFSVFGFVWLIGSWARRLGWHAPQLIAAHVVVGMLMVALAGVVAAGLLLPAQGAPP